MNALPWYAPEPVSVGTPKDWAMQNDDDRGALACLAELWVVANDPADDSDPADRLTFLDTIRYIADDVARRVARRLAELAPRPPTAYCDGCRAWCGIPHDNCIGVPLWVRMLTCQQLGIPVRDVDRALRAGTLVYDPETGTVRRQEAACVG